MGGSRKRERGTKEKGTRNRLVLGEGGRGGKEIQHGNLPPPLLSIEQGGAERPWWRPLTRGHGEAGSCSAHPRITQEGERWVCGG
jgi:hypothetical protein